MTPRWIFLNRRKLVPVVVVAVVIVLGLFLTITIFSGPDQSDNQKTFETALYNTFASNSFRFEVESKLAGDSGFYSKVEGERVMPDKVHIKGTVLKTPVEFTQVSDNTYMKDPFSGKWLTLKDIKLSQSELFITELNPLAIFNFKGIPEIEMLAKEDLDGEECLVYELKPLVENMYLEEQFSDFYYKVWVDQKNVNISQAIIKANRPENEGNALDIKIRIWDYNQDLQIVAPTN